MVRVVVVGGGIAGLAAAYRLSRLDPALEIVVLERSSRLGGKLRTAALAGATVEAGAESFLTIEAGAESAALSLAREVGLGEELVHPTSLPAALYTGGALRPIPPGTLLGIPVEPSTLDGFAVDLKDEDRGAPLIAVGADVSVGALVAPRFGEDVVRRLVDPLLGGVYAGSADQLSLAATVPGLHASAQREHTLRAAVAAAVAAARRPPGAPVFTTVLSGLSTLVERLAGPAVRLDTTVRGMTRTPNGFELLCGSTRDSWTLEAGAVVLAVPAAPAARLLAHVDAEAAHGVGELEYASVALITLALPAGTALPELSGFLVPEAEGLAVKASTFFDRKWPHRGSGPVLVRVSVGRFGDVATLRRTDAELVDTVRRELAAILRQPLPDPIEASVVRWGGALPQYGVGHVARVEHARGRLPATLALAGAAYDGVGIAACVRSGEAAARRVLAAGLGESPL